MARALKNITGPHFALTSEILEEGYQASRESPRLRIILPIQRTQDARVQRLVNFMQPGTYIQPHCHPEPHATESICLLHGALEIILFQEDGTITSHHLLTKEMPLFDIEPGIWHGMVVHEEDTVVFEVKQGPYNANTDKYFAKWAPVEGDPKAPFFLSKLSQK